MPGPRKSDIGGEVTSSSVGANVKILWREEELERVHFPLLQVPWSFVGRLRDEAEKNEHQGMMTVDLAILRQDGVPLFTDDFPATFREVFVRRFVPCLNEKFNQRDPSKPLTKLPEDVGDSVRLLVICERLKGALKQDVKDHLDRLLIRAEKLDRPARQNEGAPFKIVQASLELDHTVPPRGTLQERVVQHAIDILAGQLPESLDAIQELVQLACELQRHEMCIRLFRATAEKSLQMAGKTVPSRGGKDKSYSKLPTAVEEDVNGDESINDPVSDIKDKYEAIQESKKIEMERARLSQMMDKLEQQKKETREEISRLEHLRATMNNGTYVSGTVISSRRGQEMMEAQENNSSEENVLDNGQEVNRTSMGQDGILALRQGVLLEKVGKNTGDRIVRMAGDVLEWRKGSGRFTKEHTVFRQDVVNVKVVDAAGRTFLLSTRTGLLTLRALSEQGAQMFVQAIEAWVKGQGMKLKQIPMAPMLAAQQSMHMPSTSTVVNSRRFPRISVSFKRQPKPDALTLATYGRGGADFSFASAGEGSFMREED